MNLHVVFGAGGGAGGAVVRALASRGESVRAITRSGRAEVPRGVESLSADAGEPLSAQRACNGASIVYNCVNVPYHEWEATLPRVMEALIAAAGDAGATLVYCDNLYMYGRVQDEMRETAPAAAASGKGLLRGRLASRLLAAHEAGRVQATIGRGSDFFGPGATSTVAGQLVFPAVVAGKRAYWIGSLDAPHTLNYTEDFARGLVTLGADSRALGGIWHIPAAAPVTGREFIELAFEMAGRSPKIGVHPRMMMRFAGLFNRQMREVLEVLYQFESPFVLNAEKFTRTFGDLGVTPLREAIARTLEWERTGGTSAGPLATSRGQ